MAGHLASKAIRYRSDIMSRVFRLLFALLLTLVAADVRAAEPLRFSIVADNRGGTGFVAIAQQIARLPGGAGQFMISTGDEDPIKVTRAQLHTVFGKAFPWYPAVGNHEVENKTGADMKYLREYYASHLAGKVNPGPEGTRETTYSFDAGEVHIAVINQYWNGQTEPGSDSTVLAGFTKSLRRWLERDLRNSRKPWKLVVGHEPVYPQPDKDWGTVRHEAGALQILSPAACKDFWSILEAGGVAAYVCGHTHGYSRYQPEGSKVWQIDAAQARGDKNWNHDAFIIVTADEKNLKFETYRNLKEKGAFTVTDTLALSAKATP